MSDSFTEDSSSLPSLNEKLDCLRAKSDRLDAAIRIQAEVMDSLQESRSLVNREIEEVKLRISTLANKYASLSVFDHCTGLSSYDHEDDYSDADFGDK